VAEAVVKATEKGGFSLIGGGDSAAAINNLGFGNRCRTYPPAAAPCSNTWKAKNCPA
jgi:hypothetical protein